MHLQRLHIERIRNLKGVELTQLQPFNIFYGANGSGKSSILEAVHILATGRSFRTNLVKQYIQHSELDGLVYAESTHETTKHVISINGIVNGHLQHAPVFRIHGGFP